MSRNADSARYASVLAVDGLDLHVPQRSLFGFLGPNGAGKTTVMRLLLGLAAPTGGSAEVFGHDIVTDSMNVRRRVGYLPQQPRFHPELIARQVLRFARGFFPRNEDSSVEDDITDVLDLVGLSRKAANLAGDLSGGQRLGIAQAQILDDVQRVSDEVAILKDGRRVLRSPLHDLLFRGHDHTYVLTLAGDVGAAVADLRERPWVRDVVVPDDDVDTGRHVVRVTDDRAARHQLLRLVLRHEGAEVFHFARRRSELEDVFLEAVEGGPR